MAHLALQRVDHQVFEGPVLAPGSAEVAFADLRRDLRHLARLLLASLGEDQPIGP